jgi:hypothetical protein
MKTQNGFRKLSVILLLTAMLILPSLAIAQEEDPAHLHIWADVGYYVDSDPDAWIYQGWYVPGCAFTLNIYNKNQDPAYDVYLAVAVTDPTKITSITIGSTTLYPGDFTYGTVTWPTAAGDGTISPHGVYPAWYAFVYFGDIGGIREWRTVPGDPYGPYDAYLASTPVTIVATDGVMVHFDAQGVLVRGSTLPVDIVSNPFSHDLTSMCMYAPPTATISGLKFHDRDANGVKNATEEGLKDWEIQLWKYVLNPDPNWLQVDANFTSNDGSYSFTVDEPGTYRICEVLETGWMQTAPPTGCHEFDVALGNDYIDVDFGNIQLGSISGYKYYAFVVIDPEIPLEGWEIHLTGTDILGNPVDATAFTNSAGRFTFGNLLPGTYKVEEVFPPPPAVWVPITATSFTHTLCVGEDYVGPKFVNMHKGPVVITDPATNIGETNATLNGRILDDGGDVCEWRFDWWSSNFYASCALSGALTTGQSFQLDIDGLKPETLYYFRAYARNSAGITGGNIESFTTLPRCEGTVLLLTPNGGEQLIAGSTYEITWQQTTGTVKNVLLEYSADNGATWVDVNTVPNTGSYQWQVPQVNSQQCLVRVSGAPCPDVNDTSDNAFTIYRCTLLYDLNHDCIVNELDRDLLLSEWLKCGDPFDPNCP